MTEAYICDYVRTAIGRYGGVLKDVRTDDLAAETINGAARNFNRKTASKPSHAAMLRCFGWRR